MALGVPKERRRQFPSNAMKFPQNKKPRTWPTYLSPLSDLGQGVAISTTAFMLPRFFVQTHIFTYSPWQDAVGNSRYANGIQEGTPDVALSPLFVSSACACSPEVKVTLSSPTPFMSPRGIFRLFQ